MDKAFSVALDSTESHTRSDPQLPVRSVAFSQRDASSKPIFECPRCTQGYIEQRWLLIHVVIFPNDDACMSLPVIASSCMVSLQSLFG